MERAEVGDTIIVRMGALCIGAEKTYNDKILSIGDAWAFFGSNDALETIPALITAIKHDPDRFDVILPDGREARLFDDRENGYWTFPGMPLAVIRTPLQTFTSTNSRVI